MEFLIWLEETALGTFVRESTSLLAYPTVLFLHTLGLGFLVGVSTSVDLRILGLAPGVPLTSMERFFPWMWFGFAINAASGTALVIADATTKLISPVFYIKMLFIVLAVVNIWAIKKYVLRHPGVDDGPVPSNVKILAITSLLLWVGAITAGRLMAYIGPVSGLF